ncbi:MAG TPA: FAD-dependent oxidoreductase [Candidatus Polarisedimenticolia bacterium]|jgi:glycine/D-amino acid oxidase-like deaminating enzyme|nr:FAD-dependent oxidoreductase [Candidatus Polarisedimenticolia bacterium]
MTTRGLRVVVVGAGAFGGWSALWLVRRGARVTLIDAHGAGNVLASSGGETRVNRALYGANAVAMHLAIRSMTLWREEQARLGVELYRERGVLWMTTTADDSYLRAALPLLRDAGRACEELTPAEAERRFPAMVFDDARRVVLEPAAGYLLARRACETIAARVEAEGGTFVRGAVLPFANGPSSPGRPATSADGTLREVCLADGRRIEADQFVFAPGPWLPELFPSVLGGRIRVTRQELFTYATPAGDECFGDDRLPTWIDLGASLRYGIPAPRGLMKFGDDARGTLFDPTTGDRHASAEGERSARDYLARRFPALAQAPLATSQVCQYECTPDNQYLVDRLTGTPNVLIAGGGSGHGFKNGPAIGELVAAIVLGLQPVDRTFALARPD